MPERAVATIGIRESAWRSIRSWKPDVVYARHGLVHPGIVWAASRLPVILEVNSNDVGEYAATSSWRSAYSRTTRNQLLRRAAGLVFISHELAALRHFDAGPDNRVAIGNGIRLTDHPPFAAPSNPTPHLVFIGHPGTVWHGLDHLLELASASLDGTSMSSDHGRRARRRTRQRSAHGTLLPEDYLAHPRACRRGCGYAGPLSQRHERRLDPEGERVPGPRSSDGRGHRDTDFPDPPAFMLQIGNAPDGVAKSLESIEGFVSDASRLRVPREAIQHLDVSVKEAQRLEFIAAAAHAHR